MKKILLLAMCTVIGGLSNAAYSAQDFSFDLDSAINDADNAAGTADDKAVAPTGSSAKAIYPTVDAQSYLTASPNTYYDPALIESLITKYKQKNYVGCIQEAQAKMQQDNPNPVAMYYMALSYTQIGDVKAALDLYDAILKLKPSETLTECAVRGRDCLIGGSSCPNIGVEGADIDTGVQEYRDNILNDSTTDLKQLPDMLVDSSKKKSAEPSVEENVISAQPVQPAQTPDNSDVAQALKTLQNAGLAVTLQPAGMPVAAQNYNSEMAQMSMLLGNNNGYQNRSFDMLPYMMMQSKNNPSQYNPQMVQAMMMNYMMPSFDFNSNNNNNY
ncbi:MAG: hypothetical protein NC390_05635 [Fusobacterium sp.]|nr:hypothetical protein [Fusobacterium sp.]